MFHVYRGPDPIGGGVRQVLYLFGEKSPSARGDSRDQQAMGKAAMKAIAKGSGALKGRCRRRLRFHPGPSPLPPLWTGGPRDVREGIVPFQGPSPGSVNSVAQSANQRIPHLIQYGVCEEFCADQFRLDFL